MQTKSKRKLSQHNSDKHIAPTEHKEDDIKERFYEELQRVQDRVPKHYLKIILGDMNAKLGKEKNVQPSSGSSHSTQHFE
jgi:NAD dependent epimerase/dehydratase family enzyme